MPSMRDIRRRIKSVKSTQQITRAMKTVSAAKLRRAQERVIAGRPYAMLTREMLARVATAVGEVIHPLLEVRDSGKTAFVLVTADRGLCGGFNSNIIRDCAKRFKDLENPSLIAVGRKGRDFFRRRGVEIAGEYVGQGEDVRYDLAVEIGNLLVDKYVSGELKEVYLAFNRFINTLVQRPTVIKILPVEPPQVKEGADPVEYIFEPSPQAVLDVLLPQYVVVMVYYALLESKAGEHSARMTAMDSATKNAADMIDSLTLKLNRARQAAITKEISEIVGGAAALKA